jgi:hypothetical protein
MIASRFHGPSQQVKPSVLSLLLGIRCKLAWRYSKTELSMESPRLWKWEHRRKILLMASLAYAFLLTLLNPDLHVIRDWLLHQWCHRTGRRSHDTAIPLYRIRSALSRLWLWHQTPAVPPPFQTSG